MKPAGPAGQVMVACREFDKTFSALTGLLGFRIESIFPADAPTTAVVSGFGLTLRLETAPANALPSVVRLRLAATAPAGISPLTDVEIEWIDQPPGISIPTGQQEFVVVRASDGAAAAGRAGMRYRDLLPGRSGGRFIASHIVIPEGGQVPDYVHYHRVRFQMIFCRKGWVRVVYEDQGEPFVLHAGDCVLQPPQIRHRVLEASTGMEVIEIGCPAVHETIADHDLVLPTGQSHPARQFDGQLFVRHIAAKALWSDWQWPGAITQGFQARNTGIGQATSGLAGVLVVRAADSASALPCSHRGELLFLFVLEGTLRLTTDSDTDLQAGDCAAVPAGEEFSLRCISSAEFLLVTLPPSWG